MGKFDDMAIIEQSIQKRETNRRILDQIDQQKETKEQVLIRRVFKAIAFHHFNDHKMIEHYVGHIIFPRQLGNDLANYVRGKNPKYFQKLMKESKG